MTYFGVRLQSLRKEDDVKQMDLAKAIGVSKQTVSMWETGNRRPTFENIEAVADFFNVNVSVFFEEPISQDAWSLTRKISRLNPDAAAAVENLVDALYSQQAKQSSENH